jgi:hypothetical protein
MVASLVERYGLNQGALLTNRLTAMVIGLRHQWQMSQASEVSVISSFSFLKSCDQKAIKHTVSGGQPIAC